MTTLTCREGSIELGMGKPTQFVLGTLNAVEPPADFPNLTANLARGTDDCDGQVG